MHNEIIQTCLRMCKSFVLVGRRHWEGLYFSYLNISVRESISVLPILHSGAVNETSPGFSYLAKALLLFSMETLCKFDCWKTDLCL